jgi:hypothetical protein
VSYNLGSRLGAVQVKNADLSDPAARGAGDDPSLLPLDDFGKPPQVDLLRYGSDESLNMD